MTRNLVLGTLVSVALTMMVAPGPVEAKERNDARATHDIKQVDTSPSLVRGGPNGDRKDGRYLAAPASAKKLPGKKKPPTLTLKRGHTD